MSDSDQQHDGKITLIAETAPDRPSVQHAITSRGSLVLALCAGLASLLLAAQGWRGAFTGLDYDQVINIDEARQFVDTWRPPQVGALASVGSYNPPGTAWLIVPGILTNDPRFYERLGAIGLGALTLVGLWLVARACADDRAAALVVILYGFSSLGLFFATSLWPRRNPAHLFG